MDRPALRGAILAIQPSDSRGSYAELARSLRSLAQSAKMPVEAHLFSDMQKSSWPSNFADARLAEGTKLVFHPAVDKRLPNFAVETVNSPRRVYDPKKVRIQATISGYGTPAASKKVVLVLNGKESRLKAGRGSGGRPRQRGIPDARRALRHEPGRDSHRAGRRFRVRRPLVLLGRARRSAPHSVRLRCEQAQRADLLPDGARRVAGRGVRRSTRSRSIRWRTYRRPSSRWWCCRMSRLCRRRSRARSINMSAAAAR